MQDRAAAKQARLLTDATALLQDLGLSSATLFDPTRRIFVNRNLRFDQIRCVGFDMDYTVASYVKRNIEELSFRMTAERLVKKLGYPEEVLDIPYDQPFVVRGLCIDKRLGNIIKMDAHNHVGRVYHGRRPLNKEERRRCYRNVKIRLAAERYHWIDTLFALPEAALYAGIIELYEQQLGIKKVAYWKLFDDIRTSIDECHRDGSLKAIVQADLGTYFKEDPELPLTLHKLRSSGKRLFLLTNSFWEYTTTVMSFLLDAKLAEYPRWRNYFDVIVVGAQKPTFFKENNPFKRIDPKTGTALPDQVIHFEHRGVYQGGNINRFEELLGDRGDQVLYVGDHIYGDIIRSKKDSLWRTALILEELESELLMARQQQRVQADLVALEEHRSAIDHEMTVLKLKLSGIEQALDDDTAKDRMDELSRARRQLRMLLDRKRRDLRAVISRRDNLSQEIDAGYNPFWGSVFKEGTEASRFGEQVEDYACIYTSRVSNFLAYSPHQYFRAPRHWMPHEKI
jgi:5'-nucleotidase